MIDTTTILFTMVVLLVFSYYAYRARREMEMKDFKGLIEKILERKKRYNHRVKIGNEAWWCSPVTGGDINKCKVTALIEKDSSEVLYEVLVDLGNREITLNTSIYDVFPDNESFKDYLVKSVKDVAEFTGRYIKEFNVKPYNNGVYLVVFENGIYGKVLVATVSLLSSTKREHYATYNVSCVNFLADPVEYGALTGYYFTDYDSDRKEYKIFDLENDEVLMHNIEKAVQDILT
jgi:hypothetical protein